MGCEKNAELSLPSTLKAIGDDAFFLCDGLTSLSLLSSLNTIGERAFLYCDKITGVITIPGSVTSILYE